jgi:hypothetical protein
MAKSVRATPACATRVAGQIQRLGLPAILVLRPGRTSRPSAGIGGRIVAGVGDPPVPSIAQKLSPVGEYVVAWPGCGLAWKSARENLALPHIVTRLAWGNPPWTGGGAFDVGFESWLLAFQVQQDWRRMA